MTPMRVPASWLLAIAVFCGALSHAHIVAPDEAASADNDSLLRLLNTKEVAGNDWLVRADHVSYGRHILGHNYGKEETYGGRKEGKRSFTKSKFPADFAWGTATSAYQVEGAWNVGGKGLSIWDVFTQSGGKVAENATGNVACDHYYRYKEDIKLMAAMGVDSYRFSISWSRILPDGKTPSAAGIAFYNGVINELLKYEITPYITLYHWDLPYALDELGGWLNPEIADYFGTYASTCFKAYGDRVKYWITLNEPLSFCVLGYGNGAVQAPGRCSDRTKCTAGNSSTEPYLCGHHALRAHFKAAYIYKSKFQKAQGGKIGITCDGQWGQPLNNTAADKDAAETFKLFQMGWFLDPIFFGDYPGVLRVHLADRLPTFSAADKLFMGPVDFIGLNHYTSRAISAGGPPADPGNSNYYADNWVGQQGIGPPANSPWLNIYPPGISRLLQWLSKRYNYPEIYITENGVDEDNDPKKPLAEALKDPVRVAYLRDYLKSTLKAIKKGVKVKGYFAWSFMDNFEWGGGYTSRFGLYFVDFKDGLKRYPKTSVTWYKNFLKG